MAKSAARWLATAGLIALAGFGSWVAITSKAKRGAIAQADLLAPSDSLRRAYSLLSVLLPDDVKGCKFWLGLRSSSI